MHKLEEILSSLQRSLDNKRKRHMMGGILMSTALLLGGLALTVISMKPDGEEHERHD